VLINVEMFVFLLCELIESQVLYVMQDRFYEEQVSVED
jgi:hypothetical protein